MGVEENLRLMKTLDDAWNAGPGSKDWETFRKRHARMSPCTGPVNPNQQEDGITMIAKLWNSSKHFLTII